MPVRPLSPELAEKARVELNEDPQRLEDGISHLKEWISKQPHLRARTDDQWLAVFLRGCKFSMEKTKEKLDLYYTMRSTAPELFTVNIKDPKFLEIVKLGSFIPLPKSASPTSPVVILGRMGHIDPAKYNFTEVTSVTNCMMQLLQMENDQFTVCGVEMVMDVKGMTLGHLTQVTPSLMKKSIVFGQDASPLRMKAGHYVNMVPALEKIFNFMKPLLNEKNRNRLHVHNKSFESLGNLIPKEILPQEYGGSGGTIQEITDSWIKKVEEYREWLIDDLQFGTDESKRPGKPKTADEMFGLEGSFRQLQFD